MNNPQPVQFDPESIPLDEIDVSQHSLFRNGEVLPLFARLRRDAPVHFCRQSAFGPYWSITRHADIIAVDTNHKTFSSSFLLGGVVLDDALMKPPQEELAMSAFIGMDEPDHSRYRKAVQPIVSRDNLKHFETIATERTRKVLDGLPIGEEFDWVDKVAMELTSLMLATLFGMPPEDSRKLVDWTEASTCLEGMEGFISQEYRVGKLMECLEYFTGMWNERVNADPTPDLVSMMAHDPDTRNMTPMDYLAQLITLIVGGNDTTRNTMSASITALNQYPDEFRKVRDDHSLIDNMVRELVRWHTPAPHARRTAIEDFQFHDKLIRKGDKVVMWYYSGNRDETVFPDADRFVIDRPNANRQVSFGFGVHRCLGMAIAELQLKILWREILARYEKIEVMAPPVRSASHMLRTIHELKVKITN